MSQNFQIYGENDDILCNQDHRYDYVITESLFLKS